MFEGVSVSVLWYARRQSRLCLCKDVQRSGAAIIDLPYTFILDKTLNSFAESLNFLFHFSLGDMNSILVLVF